MMLGRLMNAGLLSQARQLAAIFEHDSPDLTIVLVSLEYYMCPDLTIVLVSHEYYMYTTTICHAVNLGNSTIFMLMLLRAQYQSVVILFIHSMMCPMQCCIQLCQGKLTPSQLTKGVLSLVSARPPRHLNDPTTSLLEDPNHSTQASEIIRMLNTLSDRATYAQQCCSCIITCFRIALVRLIFVCHVCDAMLSST